MMVAKSEIRMVRRWRGKNMARRRRMPWRCALIWRYKSANRLQQGLSWCRH